ncbi:MAG: sugar phosphate isomerase/epimerase family protein [Opitutales bacterium]
MCIRYGINLMLFSDTIGAAEMDRFPRIRDLGFEGVEVPVFDPGAVPALAIRDAAQAAGLDVTASGALPPGAKLYGNDIEARQRALDYLLGSLEIVALLGAKVFCGPLAKAVGDHDLSIPLAQQRVEAARALVPVLERAQKLGITLAFEPLNRFETGFLNLASDGVDFCTTCASPAAGLLLDTFHMHIEEKDSAQALRTAAQVGRLAHFHASESDRGIAGTGQVSWQGVGEALKAVDYAGWVVLETFNQENEAIRTAVSCWRSFYPSEDAFMREGLAFLKEALSP